MSDEKPVLETSSEEFKAVLTAVMHSHKSQPETRSGG
jgi:hypothetical protein